MCVQCKDKDDEKDRGSVQVQLIKRRCCEVVVGECFSLHFFICNRLVLKDAYLPPHLYGQLVQKKNGFKLLQRSVS